MEQFTINCTPDQTKKALELCAPIKMVDNDSFSRCIEDGLWEQIIEQGFIYIDGDVFAIPTAEQMIGWLEEQGVQITYYLDYYGEWDCVVFKKNMIDVISRKHDKKEATLAAIDVALDYLIQNNK